MDDTQFPSHVGGYLASKTFIDIFEDCPKIVEFVDSMWQSDKTTGLFKSFFVYIKNRLEVPDMRAEHEKRCCEWVKMTPKVDVPSYMLKYENIKVNTI